MLLTVGRTVSVGHRLHTYDGVCSSLHGHNMTFEVTVDVGTGFEDFKSVDAALAALTDDFDHTLILHQDDPLLLVLTAFNPPLRLAALSREPTVETLAELVFYLMTETGYRVSRVRVIETDKYSAVCESLSDDRVRLVMQQL